MPDQNSAQALAGQAAAKPDLSDGIMRVSAEFEARGYLPSFSCADGFTTCTLVKSDDPSRVYNGKGHNWREAAEDALSNGGGTNIEGDPLNRIFERSELI